VPTLEAYHTRSETANYCGDGEDTAHLGYAGNRKAACKTGIDAMHLIGQEYTDCSRPPLADEISEWFAIRTKPRHEKIAAFELEQRGIGVFLPLHVSIHQWSDRKREVQVPLFPSYLFVRLRSRNERATALRANGVMSFVGARGSGVCVPEEEIEAVKRILAGRIAFTNYPFISVGQKVRIRGGSLDGIQGILLAVNNDRSLVVSVECIQKSIAIRINGYGVDRA
jgi:transcription antitermination factor NusG